MEITLLRHGKPIIPPTHKITSFLFKRWIESYNLSGLCPTSKPTQTALTLASKCNVVVCSQLPRSIQSAEALNINDIALSHLQFNEAGLPNADWRTLKLSPMTWVVIFRVLWFFGYSNNSESYQDAKIRAKNSALKLIALAKKHENILFVGHGIFNKLIAKELKSLGWSGPYNPGSKHWSFGVYKK